MPNKTIVSLNEKAETLIKLIGFKENLTEEAIATRLKRNKAYISQQRSRGKFTAKFFRQMQMEFHYIIINESTRVVNSEGLVFYMYRYFHEPLNFVYKSTL